MNPNFPDGLFRNQQYTPYVLVETKPYYLRT